MLHGLHPLIDDEAKPPSLSRVEIAQMMNTDINLMLIKIQEMNQLEYHISMPMQPNSSFFKNIKGSQLPEEY